ncbi:MAG: tetratricopeptide repeat protein [Dehalococcoidia bacterium]|nr:MAG: tetratricopeptide repeat protein [Dehalococcoidia bacterium]
MKGGGVKAMHKKKRRVPIPEETKAQILFQNDHRCCRCHKGPTDSARIQIHHINEDPSDNRLENLAVLCRDCHDMLKDQLWMGQSFIQEEIRKYKAAWEKAVAEKRRHQKFPPATVKEKITEFDAEGRPKQLIEREISYTNGLAPQAFGISPPVSLSQSKKRVLENTKRIATSKKPAEKLMEILDRIKKAEEIGIDDMVLLSRICLSLGDSKFHEGDYTKAEAFYNEALSYGKSANEPEIVKICFYELGAAVGMLGRNKEALDCFNQVIKTDKDNPGAWFNKGVALGFLDRTKEAAAAYLKAVEFSTKAEEWGIVASAHYNMGNDLYELEKYEKAVDAYLKAIDFGTKAEELDTAASAYTNMGNALGELERYEKAFDAYRKAIEFGTKAKEWSIVARACYNMGITLGRLEKYEEAVDVYLKAIEFGTKAEKWDTVASAYYNMGVNLGKLEKYEEAVKAYYKAIESRRFLPDRGERIFISITRLICFLGSISIRDKNREQARRLAKTLSEVYQNGKEDGMAKLVVETMQTFGSDLPQKDRADAFQQFEKLFHKAKKQIEKIPGNAGSK